MKIKEEIIKRLFEDDIAVIDEDTLELTEFGDLIGSAMEEYAEQQCNLLKELFLNFIKQDKVYVTYDKNDGDIYCAYLDEQKCRKDALDSGCGVKTLNLY